MEQEDQDILIEDLEEDVSQDTSDEVNSDKKDGIVDKDILAEMDYLKQIQEFYATVPKVTPSSSYPKFLDDPLVFYRSVLNLCSKGSDLNARVNHYLEASAEDKNESRTRLRASYWNFIDELFIDFKFSDELQYLLRFGILITSAVSGNILKIIKNVDMKQKSHVSIYYIDEWLQAVSDGDINQTVVDETILSTEGMLNSEKRKLGQLEDQKMRILSESEKISSEISKLFTELISTLEGLDNRPLLREFDFYGPMGKEQIPQLKAIREKLNFVQQKNEDLERRMEHVNSTEINIEKTKNNILNYEDQVAKEKKKKKKNIDDTEESIKLKNINNKTVFDEMRAVKQMMKACIGKKGNHFPILMKDLFSGPARAFGLRERVLEEIRKVEAIDYTVFKRVIKHRASRFFPLVVLGPCYSSTGICWEPFEMANRNNTTAKIIIPMYSQDLNRAVVNALGDYRWQYAKERAGYSWMDEGLTGDFYMWHQENIKKGDLKAAFIKYYAIWIKWESNGAQKLDKELRFIFWKHAPFTQSLKNTLTSRSNVYADMLRRETQVRLRKSI